jgi:hypothetical protein
MSLGPTLEIRGLSGHPASAPSGRSAALACNPLRRQIGGLLVGGGPAGQQCERVGGRGGRLGGVDEQLPARVGGEVGALEQQVEPADDGMVEVLSPVA